ncbi:MAG: NAD(+) synthase [Eubacteriales bacterium]|nr:NAD(+) synthase [Eubacteriales bacterium]
MNYGFIKTACATPTIKVGDCIYNSEQIVSQILFASQHTSSLVVFPELCVTGYTCGDMFLNRFLIEQAQQALKHILLKTKMLSIISVVGVPVAVDDALYNCAAVIYKGEILGLVPKTNLPNYNEFNESRYFTSGKDIHKVIKFADQDVLLSSKLVFSCNQIKEFKFAIEISEDMMVPCSPSLNLVTNGKATVICNIAASSEYAGKSQYRKDLVRLTSGKLKCAYLYASSGPGESTTDAVYSAHNIIAENASVLAESVKFSENVTFADIDVQKIIAERRKNNNFTSTSDNSDIHYVDFDITLRQTRLNRKFRKYPFIPSEKAQLKDRCEDILTMQSIGLATRMQSANIEHLVLGISGGLDSTLALIISIKALDILGLSHKNLHAISMPCFGTTHRTKSNAEKLSVAYGADFEEIDITRSVRQHFIDIGQSEDDFSTTYENAQARQRTMVLMDVANKIGALVVGTGDMSELALGWATYNGDHMSMYAVNASVPKTLVRCLVEYETYLVSAEISAIIRDILDTPVSPELLPPNSNGEISQITENVVGPYELHDFFLYYLVRYGFSPEKIFYLALKTFEGDYDRYVIKKWMQKFFIRFFTQQYKRSCMPDGPKVGSISLSPRGDFKMPSDMQMKQWIDRINEL